MQTSSFPNHDEPGDHLRQGEPGESFGHQRCIEYLCDDFYIIIRCEDFGFYHNFIKGEMFSLSGILPYMDSAKSQPSDGAIIQPDDIDFG